jgi:hypothetical protein
MSLQTSFIQFPQKMIKKNELIDANEDPIDDFVVENDSDQYDIGRYSVIQIIIPIFLKI